MRTELIMILLLVPMFMGCVDTTVAGDYIQNNNSYLVLKEDGTFQQHGIKYHMPFSVEGKYTINESNITLHYPYGYYSKVTITKTGLIDNTGAIYEKQK